MNGTNVSNWILNHLAGELSDLTPEARKAATYVLENPRDVGVSTVREIAEAANVKPNTVVRMARQVCLLYTSPSPRDVEESRMPSSA